MPRLRALTDWADRKRGDEWNASDDDARLLTACDLPGGAKAELVDRSMTPAESERQTPAEPNPPVDPKRRYLRRDMQARS
jgi:hypothetical protein